MNGTAILKADPMIGAILALRRSFAASTRCTTRKSVVQYPNEMTNPKPEHDAEPVHAHRIRTEMTEAAPHVRIVLAGPVVMDAAHQTIPSANFHQAENGYHNRPQPDQEELQNLVENG